MAEMTHSRLGASSCKRWMNCPGSVMLLETVPKRSSSIYAAEGTLAHSFGENYLRTSVPSICVDRNGQLGEIKEVDGFEIKVTKELIEAATLYANTVLEDMVKYELFFPEPCWAQTRDMTKNVDKHKHLFIEQQFSIDSIDAELSGTNDASVYVPGQRLIIYDYKHGKGVPVEVEENEQLMFYALGALEKLNAWDVEVVELVIIQPRCNHSDGPIRRWETNVEELRAFGEQLREGVARVRSGVAEYSSGSHCRWCDGKTVCPQYRGQVNQGAQMTFAPALCESEPVVLEPPKACELSVQQISDIMKNIPVVKSFIDEIESRATELLNQGIEVPGFKLVYKKANRKWIDEDEVIAVFGDKATDVKIKTPAQLEKIFGKEKVADYAMIPEAGTTIVPESDKRQGVTPVQQVFDCIGFDLDMDI